MFILFINLCFLFTPIRAEQEYEVGFEDELEDYVLEVIGIDESELSRIFGKFWYKDCEFLEESWKMKFNITDINKVANSSLIDLEVNLWNWRVQDFGDSLPVETSWKLSLDPDVVNLPTMFIFIEEDLRAFFIVPVPVNDYLKDLSKNLGKVYSAEDNTLLFEGTSLEEKEYTMESLYDAETGLIKNIKIKNEKGSIIAEIDGPATISGFNNIIIIGVSFSCVIGIITLLRKKIQNLKIY